MKKLLMNLATGIAAFVFASQAVAQVGITLSLQPTPQNIHVGDATTMSLVVSGLGNFSAPSLAAYEFYLSYNPAILSATSVAFGSFLDLGVQGSLQFSDLSTAGLIHLHETSLESSTNLNNAQPGTFTLATLGFTGLAPGNTAIAFTSASLANQQGLPITGFSTSNGAIAVTVTTAVPDLGSTALLLLLGIVSLVAIQRRAQSVIG